MLKLYGHGGSGNHGCEAIVRSTVGILGGEIELLSQHPERDLRYGIDQVCRVTEDTDTPPEARQSELVPVQSGNQADGQI